MKMQNTFFLQALSLWMSLVGCNKHELYFPLMEKGCDKVPSRDQFWNYIEHPDVTDTTCIADLQKAEKEFAEGKLAFSLYHGQTSNKRYQEELEKLCMAQGLSLHLVFFGCIYFPGQTKGCYEAFMDQKIMERYGKDFKCQLINKADSIFLTNTIINDDVVHSSFCDTLPTIPDKFHGTRHLVLFEDGMPYDIQRMDRYVEIPNFLLHIVIEKNGTISRLSKADKIKIPFGSPSDYAPKDEVVDQVFNFIKKEYPTWKPSQIKGVPVRTIFTMNIFISGT